MDLETTKLGIVEVMIGSGKVRTRVRRTRAGSKGDPQARKQGEKAREAARKRMARAFPAIYEVFVAEERRRRGLEPWPVDIGTPLMRPGDFDRQLRELMEAYLATSGPSDVYDSGDGSLSAQEVDGASD